MEESIDFGFAPSVAVVDGDRVPDTPGLSITAVHTPGHTSNHTCWALAEERALFTGDHVMGWSTTVVAPPDGDMAAYIASLRTVAERDDGVLWPTHGPPRDDASEYVAALVAHRLERERGVLEAVDAGRATIGEIVALLYADVRQELHKAAGMSVWSHLLKLVAEGQVEVEGSGPATLAARYHGAR
jgi:glyoxylase-like metal-dependent hydrolase (beta-lactamase superfamily II)